MNVFFNNFYNAVKKMNITTPMYAFDILKAARVGRGHDMTVLNVIDKLVADGVLLEVEGKYGYNKYITA